MNGAEIRAGLDTSVLMRLLVGQPERLAESACAFLAEVEEAGAKVLVSNLVVAEAYFACQHHYHMPKGVVLSGIRELLSKSTFVVQPALLELLSRDDVASSKPGFIDRLIHSEYAAHDIPLVTFEKAGNRLSGTRVLDAPD